MKKALIHSPQLEQYSYPDSCPFKTFRAALLYRKLLSMGLLSGPDVFEAAPEKAERSVLEQFHSSAYLDALERANRGEFDSSMFWMGLGTGDCPVFDGVYDYAALAAGATITGARLILEGKAGIAFNPSGGYHHAHAGRAGGFCYLNDVVLGCLEFVKAGKRVLFLDVDVHHCDGVQAAFYDRADVMTISTHQDGRTLFPGTGFVDEIGEGEGRGYSVNFPLPPGVYDEVYLKVFREGVLPLIGAYGPDVIVLEIGADTLAGDPLAGFSLTNNVYVEVVQSLLVFGKPILAVGGGGYHVENTVRAWALVWATLCGRQQTDETWAGLGGVMLQSTDWNDDRGLRDRVLVPSNWQRESVLPAAEQVLNAVRRTVFPLHGLS
ncbi:MAG TPA: acetoin utilization protein AcuC [Anaerohalosphaeraceae bacterium]|nr:acetoin utilization protein AcuC [Anaerohalosphaeraceae bacterium]